MKYKRKRKDLSLSIQINFPQKIVHFFFPQQAFKTPLTIFSTQGTANLSMVIAQGIGISAPVILSMGASRQSKASDSIMIAAISEPIPHQGHPSSTLTILFVFLTESMIAYLSKGLIVLKLMTSALIPCSFCKISAACKENPTILAKAVIVTSVPYFSIFALPIGITKSLSIT